MSSYKEAWPQYLKDLYWRYYRAMQKAENLRNYIQRVDPKDFEKVMDDLEQAEKDFMNANSEFFSARRQWEASDSVRYSRASDPRQSHRCPSRR